MGQNPQFYVTPTSGLLELVFGARANYTNSPEFKAQDAEDIINVQQAVQFVLQNAGPDQAKIGFKQEDFGTWVASKTGMPAELVRTPTEKAQVIQAGAQAAQAGMKTSQPPMPMQ